MPLNLGFIGGGLNSAVGYTHFVASKLDGHFEVSAGCFSRDPMMNTETAKAYGVASNRTYADLDRFDVSFIKYYLCRAAFSYTL